MEKKKSLGSVLGTFFSGKGFYIVLLLSAAVIATSVWLMFAGRKTNVESNSGESELVTAQAEEEAKADLLPQEPQVEQGLSGDADAGEAEEVWNETESAEAATDAADGADELPLYFIWPVSGPLERGHSEDTLLYDQTMADWRTHDGWDISAALGAQVMAAADGTVSAVYTDDLYGTVVEIDHGGGLVSRYANLAATPTVNVGDTVQVGDVIGAVGDTALAEVSQDYHLHFAMKLDGESADPANWLPAR